MPSQQVSQVEQGVIRAEAMFSELIVKSNLPLTTADIITKTVKSAFPDSKIAQSYSCSRNKTTAIITSMAEDIKVSVKDRMLTGPFCVATDGSNEQREKQYPVVITTIGESGISTDLLSVPTLDLQSASTGKVPLMFVISPPHAYCLSN